MTDTPRPHGGARPNAGRKPKPASECMVKRSVCATEATHARVRAFGDGELSAGYRRMVDELLPEDGGADTERGGDVSQSNTSPERADSIEVHCQRCGIVRRLYGIEFIYAGAILFAEGWCRVWPNGREHFRRHGEIDAIRCYSEVICGECARKSGALAEDGGDGR